MYIGKVLNSNLSWRGNTVQHRLWEKKKVFLVNTFYYNEGQNILLQCPYNKIIFKIKQNSMTSTFKTKNIILLTISINK